MAEFRLTQLAARVAVKGTPTRRVTQASARVATKMERVNRVTSVSARVAFRDDDYRTSPAPDRMPNRFTSLGMRVLYKLTPDFRWIEMFSDDIFPNDISFNSDGTTVFSTEVITVDSGHDQRNSRWDEPLMEYNVAYGVRTLDHLHDLIRFFRKMKGQLYAFRFRDPIDYTSSFATGEDAREPDPITALDQVLATGDGQETVFQLIKEYGEGSEFATRTITKPEHGTVIMAVGGTPVTNWTCDYGTGIVEFSPRKSVAVANAVLTNIQPYIIGVQDAVWRITGTTEDMTFNIGERIILSGFTDPDNTATTNLTASNVPDFVDGLRVNSSGEGFVEFIVKNGEFGVEETASIVISSHPAPDFGLDVTAGYKFHVPVRFATDRLPTRLEFYGGGSANDVRLIEVRKYEED